MPKSTTATLTMEDIVHTLGLEAVPIDTIRASNAQAASMEGLVVVLVGGTGGIGRNVAKELFKRTRRPKAYIIGRNDRNGREVLDELHSINPEGQAIFLKKDIQLIRHVDEVCTEILTKEKKINGLILTAGAMSLGGRDASDEGIDKRMAVNYYSRMRFIFNFLPALDAAALEYHEISRVITVLAAGSEKDILHLDDLDLRHNWNLHECLAHCVIMADFMVEEFSHRHPHTTFIHSFPGSVKSGIANSLTSTAKLAVKVLYATMNTWVLNVAESGERHFFQLTSECYRPASISSSSSSSSNPDSAASTPAGIPIPTGLSPMQGTDGTPGSGSYLLDWDCKPTGDKDTINKYRSMNLGQIVWDHTNAMFDQALQRQKSGEGGLSRKDSSNPTPPIASSASTPTAQKRPAGEEAEGAGSRSRVNPTGWRPA